MIYIVCRSVELRCEELGIDVFVIGSCGDEGEIGADE